MFLTRIQASLRIAACLSGALLACLWIGPVAAATESVYPALHWSEAAPAVIARWSATELAAADQAAAELWSDDYLVVQHGVIVHRYGDTRQALNIQSMRKSLLSMLTGIYAARGQINLSQNLASLGISDRQGLSALEQSATVQELLQSRSGVYHPAAYETPAMRAECPARGSHRPGSFWYYNNWDFNALGDIFHQRTGSTVFEAFRTELAIPLQLEEFQLNADSEFVYESVSEHPAYLFKLSAEDLARVGLLMARHGRWRDKQLLPAAWVDRSTAISSQAHAGRLGYGYLWWVAQSQWPFWTNSAGHVFFAWGDGGQFLLIDPQRDLVIVHQVDMSKAFHPNVSPDALGKLLIHILAAAPDGAISATNAKHPPAHGPEPHPASSFGITPLMLAADSADSDLVKKLLAQGADPDARDQSGNSVLMHAAAGGSEEILSWLLTRGAQVNQVNQANQNGWTALMSAAERGHTPLVKRLLAQGANPEAQSRSGWTALMCAAHSGYPDLLEALLAAGANPARQRADGRSALIDAAAGGKEPAVHQLLEHGAAVNLRDKSGATALSYAARNGEPNVVRQLLAHGAQTAIIDRNGNTPLSLALSSGNLDVAQLLLEKGADADTVDIDGLTPLMIAASGEDAELVRQLLSHGANPNRQNRWGKTALMIAATGRSPDIVRRLLVAGTDPQARDASGWTARTLALSAGNLDLAALLP